MANKGLGRGLDSLFGNSDKEFDNAQKTQQYIPPARAAGTSSAEIAVSEVYPNPEQPRKTFDADALKELENSIRTHGVIQPLVVTETPRGYMIIAGERRWRAAANAGLSSVPCVIKNYTDKEIREIALIENLQREDLNPIEAASAIRLLMTEYNFTQEAVADRIGKSRPNVANLLRLLNLYPEVQLYVISGRLSAGHARVLASLKDKNAQLELAEAAADNKMTVRELERALRDYNNPKKKSTFHTSNPFAQSVELKELKELMRKVFATKVEIFGNDDKGRIYIDYYTRDDIDRIAEIMFHVKQ